MLSDIPDDILEEILCYLSYDDLIRMSATCRHLRHVSMQSTIWSKRLIADYPHCNALDSEPRVVYQRQRAESRFIIRNDYVSKPVRPQPADPVLQCALSSHFAAFSTSADLLSVASVETDLVPPKRNIPDSITSIALHDHEPLVVVTGLYGYSAVMDAVTCQILNSQRTRNLQKALFCEDTICLAGRNTVLMQDIRSFKNVTPAAITTAFSTCRVLDASLTSYLFAASTMDATSLWDLRSPSQSLLHLDHPGESFIPRLSDDSSHMVIVNSVGAISYYDLTSLNVVSQFPATGSRPLATVYRGNALALVTRDGFCMYAAERELSHVYEESTHSSCVALDVDPWNHRLLICYSDTAERVVTRH